jgi:phytanoyl-CoA hydroxylase
MSPHLDFPFYRRNGFAVIRELFSTEEVKDIENHVTEYLDRTGPVATLGDFLYEDNAERSLRCAFRLHEHSEYFAALMQEPRIIELLQQIFDGADVVADGTMLINKAPFASYEFPYHQDNAYQFWGPPEAIGVTLALDESSKESGAITCLSGSHTMGVFPHQPSGVFGASRGLVNTPTADEYTEEVLTLNPGDISLHHVNTIHRTGPNQTPNQRRNLGFSYHSSFSAPDKIAVAQYEHEVKEFLQSETKPKGSKAKS